MAVRIGRQRGWTWVVVAALVCVFGAVPHAREYRTIEIESLRVTIDTDWAPRTTPGYAPIRFDITNLGDARVIELVGRGSRSFHARLRGTPPVMTPYGVSSMTVSQTLRLRRGDRVKFTMSLPVFGDSESFRFELREDNRMLDTFSYYSLQSRTAVADASVLFVTDAASPFGAIAPKLTRTMGTHGSSSGGSYVITRTPGSTTAVVTGSVSGGPRMPPIDYALEPARLPVTWLGYTSLRAVAIGKTEWAQLNDQQKSALITWVACGGDLILVDAQPADLVPSMPVISATGPDRTVGRHFLGRVHAITSAALEAAGMVDVLTAVDSSRNRAWSLPANGASDWGTIETRGFRLPIPGIEGVPARVYLSILLLFSLIIGPVSFWYLWRRKQRVLLVLTAPLISLIFIVLLAGYAIAGEGFGVHGRAVTFTVLDETTKQAVTRASVSMYAAGMTPSGGMHFGRDVAVFPIGPTGDGSRERMTIDLTETQRFSAGVLQARAPTNVEEVTLRPSRERLSFTRAADGITVVNGLDATMTHLVYRDGQTTYRLDAPLAAGAKRTLTAGAIAPGQLVPDKFALSSKFIELVEHQPEGTYLAVLERSPFWDPGVSNLTERGSLHVVLGWPQGQR